MKELFITLETLRSHPEEFGFTLRLLSGDRKVCTTEDLQNYWRSGTIIFGGIQLRDFLDDASGSDGLSYDILRAIIQSITLNPSLQALLSHYPSLDIPMVAASDDRSHFSTNLVIHSETLGIVFTPISAEEIQVRALTEVSIKAYVNQEELSTQTIHSETASSPKRACSVLYDSAYLLSSGLPGTYQLTLAHYRKSISDELLKRYPELAGKLLPKKMPSAPPPSFQPTTLILAEINGKDLQHFIQAKPESIDLSILSTQKIIGFLTLDFHLLEKFHFYSSLVTNPSVHQKFISFIFDGIEIQKRSQEDKMSLLFITHLIISQLAQASVLSKNASEREAAWELFKKYYATLLVHFLPNLLELEIVFQTMHRLTTRLTPMPVDGASKDDIPDKEPNSQSYESLPDDGASSTLTQKDRFTRLFHFIASSIMSWIPKGAPEQVLSSHARLLLLQLLKSQRNTDAFAFGYYGDPTVFLAHLAHTGVIVPSLLNDPQYSHLCNSFKLNQSLYDEFSLEYLSAEEVKLLLKQNILLPPRLLEFLSQAHQNPHHLTIAQDYLRDAELFNMLRSGVQLAEKKMLFTLLQLFENGIITWEHQQLDFIHSVLPGTQEWLESINKKFASLPGGRLLPTVPDLLTQLRNQTRQPLQVIMQLYEILSTYKTLDKKQKSTIEKYFKTILKNEELFNLLELNKNYILFIQNCAREINSLRSIKHLARTLKLGSLHLGTCMALDFFENLDSQYYEQCLDAVAIDQLFYDPCYITTLESIIRRRTNVPELATAICLRLLFIHESTVYSTLFAHLDRALRNSPTLHDFLTQYQANPSTPPLPDTVGSACDSPTPSDPTLIARLGALLNAFGELPYMPPAEATPTIYATFPELSRREVGTLAKLSFFATKQAGGGPAEQLHTMTARP